jgi:cytochrome b
MSHRIRVWDLPTRVFHWLLVLSVVTLVVTGNIGGDMMAWHFRAGYVVLSLLLFRLVWGFAGGHWSRFTQFIYSPKSLLAYLKGQAHAHHTIGHNPMGALSVFGLLGFLALQVASGLFSDDEIASTGPLSRFVSADWVSLLTWFHKDVGKVVILAMVALHVVVILFYLFKKKDNLIGPMVWGDKHLPPTTPQGSVPESKDNAASRVAALVTAVVCFGLVFGAAAYLN